MLRLLLMGLVIVSSGIKSAQYTIPGRKRLLAIEEEGRKIAYHLVLTHTPLPEALSALIADYLITDLSCFIPMKSHQVRIHENHYVNVVEYLRRLPNACWCVLLVRLKKQGISEDRQLIQRESLRNFEEQVNVNSITTDRDCLAGLCKGTSCCHTLFRLGALLRQRVKIISVDSEEYRDGIKTSKCALQLDILPQDFADCLEYFYRTVTCRKKELHNDRFGRAHCAQCTFLKAYQDACSPGDVPELIKALRQITPGFTMIHLSDTPPEGCS